MANETLGASFSIDVTDLKSGLAQANRLIRESESEFKAAASEMDDWSQSQDGLSAKIKSLNNITAVQKEKVKALQKEYDRLISEGLDPTSKQAVELRTKINNETTALNKNEAELKKQTQALEELESSSGDAGKKLKNLGDSADASGKKLDGLKGVAKGVAAGVAAIGAACVAGVSAFLGLAESTKETQVAMAKLEQSFSSAGLSANDAASTMNSLYGVLGDMDKSTEAANLLAKMSVNTSDLEANTRILTGVFAEYGDSIPTEGLAEGMQATAQMGTVQGVLADALEWQGVNLDEYNEKLASMTSAEERAAYIQSTLIGLYGESADAYRENNKALIESNEAQLQIEKSLAEIGKVALPIVTELKKFAAELLNSITPFVQLFGEGLTGAFNGAADAAQKLADGLSGILTTAVNKITEALPTVINTIVTMFPAVISAITTALPSIIQAVVDAVPQITQALLDSIPLLITCITDIISNLLTSLGTLLPEIVNQIIDIIPQIISALVEAIPQLLEAAIQFLMAIVQAIPTIIDNLLSELPNIIDTIITGLLNALPQLLEAAIQLFMAIIEAIPKIIESLIENLPKIIETIISAVINSIPLLLDAAIKLLMALIEAIPTIIKTLIVELPKIITTIVTTLLKNIPTLIKASIELFLGIIKAIPQIVIELAKSMPEIIKAIVEGLKEGFGAIVQVGGDLIRGLWEGIKDMGSWIGEKIKGFGENVLGGIKKFFGIASPSKVMADQVGKNLALGIGKGFENNIGKVNDEITSAMNFDDARISVNGTRGFARGGVNVYQTNNYSQAHSRYEIYKSKKQTEAAVRLALGTV